METEPGNDSPLVIWAQSEEMLRRAAGDSRGPVAVLVGFRMEPAKIREIAIENGFDCRQLEGEAQVKPNTIYFFSEDKSFSLADLAGHHHMIEELRSMYDSMQKRAMEISESNAELERFAYVASHDLQEPLRMVTSFLQLLKKKYDGQLDDTGRQYISFAIDASDRMKKLIHDLLEYSRVGSNKEDLTMVDLNMVLYDVIKLFSDTIEKAGATIEIGHLPLAMGKKLQLMQLFQNLISNALKYRSRKPPVIKISWRETPEHLEFRVADNGIGIDPKHREKIFVIFQRLHNKNEYSGTGIGLAICKKIIERHGGKMWVESAEEQGSVFCFTLAK
jgi:light-regulated signal transduction histidine kinase (bacteriophytochrome)